MSLVAAVRLMAETLDHAVVVTDGALDAPGPIVLYVNPAFERMTGYTSQEMVGRSPRILQGAGTSLAARKALARSLRVPQPHETTLVNYRKCGEAYRCHIQVYPVTDESGRLINAIAIEQEVKRGPGRPRAARHLLGSQGPRAPDGA
ncbi:PAS domain-containing protein [Phenylobacterium sp. 20VBR1]|uniref:PAS domain-containing protein n=1 Tax=Phenylobacterium glaciei TaxID=2803784 RepID=A0A941D2I5_9CAUL|nr:PAS domain-containing protein [Phenylobacterium glaciei]